MSIENYTIQIWTRDKVLVDRARGEHHSLLPMRLKKKIHQQCGAIVALLIPIWCTDLSSEGGEAIKRHQDYSIQGLQWDQVAEDN